ncbi:FHA domain-containing protein [Acidobacteriota bacterium]
MKRISLFILMTGIFIFGMVTNEAFAGQEWVSDILANPSRYWNRTVTVVGQVQAVTANPVGTTRGIYTLLDDSGLNPITIRTNDLPPIGRNYAVTGVIIQDPTQANVPVMKELKRTSPGMPSSMKILLFGGGALFLILLIIFIVLLVKPKEKAPVQATIRPGVRPTSSAPDLDKTTKIPTVPSVAPLAPDKTQVFMSLGAEIIVEKGPDQGKEIALHKQVTTIGRAGARKNDIELADDTVSKEQASIFYDNTTKQFSLSNESMTNPTKVNNQMITESLIVKNDDLIEIGKIALRFKQK